MIFERIISSKHDALILEKTTKIISTVWTIASLKGTVCLIREIR